MLKGNSNLSLSTKGGKHWSSLSSERGSEAQGGESLMAVSTIKNNSIIAGESIIVNDRTVSVSTTTKMNFDCNDCNYTCFAYLAGSNISNTPSGVSTAGFFLCLTRTDAPQYRKQFFMPYNSVSIYARTMNNGVWTSWATIQPKSTLATSTIKLTHSYKAGDSIQINGCHCIGTLTGTRNLIRFFIPLNAPVVASNFSFTTLKISVRSTVGTIVNSIDVTSASGYSITSRSLKKNGAYVQVTASTAFSSATNDTPLDVQIDEGTLVFS